MPKKIKPRIIGFTNRPICVPNRPHNIFRGKSRSEFKIVINDKMIALAVIKKQGNKRPCKKKYAAAAVKTSVKNKPNPLFEGRLVCDACI